MLKNTVFEHRDTVTHGEGFCLVVGHIDGGDAEATLQGRNLGSGLNAQFCIQVRQWLVHQEHLRFTHDSATHGYALALSTRECFGLPVEIGLQVKKLCCFENPRGTFVFVDAGNLERKTHVLCHGHVGVESVVLEDHGDVTVFRCHIGHVAISNENATAVDVFQARQHAKRGGLSTARGANQYEELSIVDGEIESIYCGKCGSGIDATCFIKRH